MSADVDDLGYRTWRYRSWVGQVSTVVADSITFEATHIVWRDHEGHVVLAERPEQVNQLQETDNLGYSTRHPDAR